MSYDLNKIVSDIYAKSKKPLFLARLGEILKKEYNVYVPNLFNAVNSLSEYEVVCATEKKERSAVSSVSDIEATKALLNAYESSISNEDLKFLDSLQRNLLIAICSRRRASPNYYIQGSSPFHHYEKKEQEGLLEIQEEFLLDILVPYNLSSLTSDAASQLKGAIDRWSKKNLIDLSSFKKSIKQDRAPHVTLLDQLISAIPQNKRRSLAIPLDIIEFLIKKD